MSPLIHCRRQFAVRSFALALVVAAATDARAQIAAEHMHDLSLLLAPDLPCVWPLGMTPLAVVPTRTIGPGSYRRDLLVIDEHTGTQFDAPAHFIPPPDSGLPGAGPMGRITADKVPVWQFVGEACVIDVTEHRDDAPAGSSYLIRPDTVRRWEQAHRPLRAGDVPLFKSGYTDTYYQPFPAGNRLVAAPVAKDTPGWPAPTPDTMIYLAEQGVTTLGLDGASMGPLPDLAPATHQAGGQRGMIWIECATNLGSLPETGAFLAMLAPKHAEGSGSECRVLAITDPKLAPRLIDAARAHRVVDLSVTLHEEYPITWPGQRPGDEASRYVGKTLNSFSPARGPYFARTHLLDGQAGTHLVLPSFSLPAAAADRARYDAATAALSAEFEQRLAPLGTSDMHPADAALPSLCGELHLIDVRKLRGTTSADRWPSSPLLSREMLEEHDRVRPIRPGEIIVFFSGYTDEHFQPLPASPALDPLFAAPLAGKAEGWPAPTPEALSFLAERGVRCVGTDGPTLGGADPRHAQFVYWMAGTKGLFAVEFLTGLSELAERKAFFLFAPVKLRDGYAGYGRALALYDEP